MHATAVNWEVIEVGTAWDIPLSTLHRIATFFGQFAFHPVLWTPLMLDRCDPRHLAQYVTSGLVGSPLPLQLTAAVILSSSVQTTLVTPIQRGYPCDALLTTSTDAIIMVRYVQVDFSIGTWFCRWKVPEDLCLPLKAPIWIACGTGNARLCSSWSFLRQLWTSKTPHTYTNPAPNPETLVIK